MDAVVETLGDRGLLDKLKYVILRIEQESLQGILHSCCTSMILTVCGITPVKPCIDLW